MSDSKICAYSLCHGRHDFFDNIFFKYLRYELELYTKQVVDNISEYLSDDTEYVYEHDIKVEIYEEYFIISIPFFCSYTLCLDTNLSDDIVYNFYIHENKETAEYFIESCEHFKKMNVKIINHRPKLLEYLKTYNRMYTNYTNIEDVYINHYQKMIDDNISLDIVERAIKLDYLNLELD